jgi:FkbM family methyltransferase
MTAAPPKPAKPPKYPRVQTVSQLHPAGLRFHVASDGESFRVGQLGGELEFTRSMLDELHDGDVFYDVGSCIGLVAAHVAARGHRVVAFEPAPAFRHRLKENLELNGLAERVQIAGWAVADSPGEAELFSDDIDGLSPCLREVTGADRGTVRVRVDSIDCAIAAGEIPPATVIKLDVEGAEGLALRGMKQLLAGGGVRTVFVELHPAFLPRFGTTLEEAVRPLEDAGYVVAHEETRYSQLHRVYRRG